MPSLQYMSAVIYIGNRYFHINNILRQLLPDIMIKDYIVIADKNIMFAADVRNDANFNVKYYKNSIFLVKEVYPQSEKQRKYISDHEAPSNKKSGTYNLIGRLNNKT